MKLFSSLLVTLSSNYSSPCPPNTESLFKKQNAVKQSKYGYRYNSVLSVTKGSKLQFIHQTASNFLSNTESGAKILSFDTSSDFTIYHQLTKAWLAKLTVFICNNRYDGVWARRLRLFRKAREGTKDWVLKDWDRLILICKKLANSEILFEQGAGDFDSATPCVGIDFLRAAARENLDDKIIISRLTNRT